MSESAISNDLFDSKPLKERVEILLRRHKQYHNLATYLAQNMKQEKGNDIQNLWMPLLQKSK